MEISLFGLSKVEGQHGKASYRCCIMRKVLHTELAAGGRFNFVLDSAKQFAMSQFFSKISLL